MAHIVNIKQIEDKRGYMWYSVIDPYRKATKGIFC